ncbi:MAG TPA: NAD(P)/FAD-dependent oxidoreductase [Nocardioides sp.]|uniref:phytoene desaturase family protein n=1 Tax=Nocardioides sp. TaxID=35761 RepID=UPI002C382B42|nr:NAD(P)/FAD-dependent oxidoreductase [Nocardioides sp.]HQR26840.1 NAD(P)/FAD-dependent oxidoreductase [Nocardioides sp.]
MGSAKQRYDVVVVGGGHNGLTAAAYLARAGLSVLVLERLPEVGGAAVSAQPFPGRPARLSRYAYLVSLLPDQIVTDLDLDLQLASRSTASYTPLVRDGRHTGLLVERPEGAATRASFRVLTGSTEEYDAWRAFYDDVGSLVRAVAPTLLSPLPVERDIRSQVESRVWDDLVATPLGRTLEARFRDDGIRGVVATDALIGTFTSLHDPSLVQNRTFLHHAMGNGTGEWRVPVGGMGAVTAALARAAVAAGTEILTSAGVSALRSDEDGAEVTWRDATGVHTVGCRIVLSNVAPWVLEILLGSPDEPENKPQGAQLKINLLLDRLPRLRSGINPQVAFAGTFHVAQGYAQLEEAYAEADAGRLPAVLPGELYCHSLTDPSILGELADRGAHTLTYFGLFTPPSLFEESREEAKAEAVRRALEAIDEHLVDEIASCVATDAHGNPCIEARIPQEVEAELAMPGGHIYHGDVEWPWASNRARLDTPAQQWGVQTDQPSVLVCGSGARRGGGVSGLSGHHAAQAVLASR